ncbi:hypothetical protein ACFOG5_24505 [Pedobacter fastidiosus]|uniref:hypothetical protein n=1 Tax=Pedobacter fastidiosus TaxID=2765361 RepID=UPI003623E2D9
MLLPALDTDQMGLGIGARYVYGLEKISDVNIGNLGGEMKTIVSKQVYFSFSNQSTNQFKKSHTFGKGY